MMATEERDAADWDQEEFHVGQPLHIGQPLLRSDAPARSSAAKAGKAPSRQPTQRMNVCGLLSLQYYQPFFDVDTSQVRTRLFQAAWPIRKASSSFLGEEVSGCPTVDLYGPVWVSATLIFLLSVAANARRGMMDGSPPGEFDEVSTSTYSVLAYLVIGCAGLWGFFRAHNVPLSVAEALSVYGYSLTPYIAATPLCLLSWPFRSCGFATTSLLAAIFVLRSSWPRLQEHMPEKSMMLLLAAVGAYHVLWFLWLSFV